MKLKAPVKFVAPGTKPKVALPRKPDAEPPSVPVESAEALFYDLSRDGVTQSLIERLLACPMKAELSMRQGLASVRFKGALAFGNAVHAALETAYATYRDTNSMAKATANASYTLESHERTVKEDLRETMQLSAQTTDDLEEIYATAAVVLKHYFLYYKTDFDGSMGWESLEEVFRVPYTINAPDYAGGPIQTFLRGKTDARYRRNKRPWIMDHKTKSKIEEDGMMLRLHIDLQTLFYAEATRRMLGEIPAGMLYNVIRRPQLRRGKDETLRAFCERIDADIPKRRDFYFMRYEVALAKSDLDAFAVELETMLRLLFAWYSKRVLFRNSGSCESKYGLCEFLRLCSRGDKEGLKRREHVFPELVQLEGFK